MAAVSYVCRLRAMMQDCGMVAILVCDFHVESRLDWQAAHGRALEYTEAWRRTAWEGAQPHLALILDSSGYLQWLGRAKGGRRITTLDRIVSITEVLELDHPIEIEDLEPHIPTRHRSTLFRRGVLPPRGGDAVISALLTLFPDLASTVARLGRRDVVPFPGGRRGEVLNMERDALGVLLELTGMSRAVLREWAEPPPESPYLAGLPAIPPIEDAQISYDIDRFPGLVREPDTRVEWRVFSGDGRRLLVMNANRTSVEHTLGVDVVYLNEPEDSFVLVQYKRLRRAQRSVSSPAVYRPDANLADELDRMRAIDQLSYGVPGAFRLLSTPCWLKLTDPSPAVNDPTELLKGMYFAREHFEELLSSLRGPRGGVRIGYDNVDRYMTNTAFTALVKDGWIGSRGAASADINRLINESLATGHAVLVGVSSATDPSAGGTSA